jgi:hypothetical protein
MSRAAGLQKAGEQSPRQPWYYRDVPGWVILGFVSAVALAILTVGFRPVRTAPPVTVVAPGDKAPPWKAPIPQQLPMPSLPSIPPPVIAPPAPTSSSAIDAILSPAVTPPAPPEKR